MEGNRLWRIVNISLAVVTVLVAIGGFVLHAKLHSKNQCDMTFMWRRLQFLPVEVHNTSDVPYQYSMIIYNEGPVNWDVKSLKKNEIPVLFVPGSGGSARQVRSMASVVQNKTEMRQAAFRFRFFAVDFDDQLSFVSGRVLTAQRDYVLKAIRTIRTICGDNRKIVLMGHSFGGTLILSLLAHPEFDPSWVDLVILKAAPLANPPLFTDYTMMRLYNEMHDNWHSNRDSKLSAIGVVSYSGGLKDVLVPDQLTNIEHMVSRGPWSVRGVRDVGADHLCVLWCNMLVRHASRIFYNYGDSYFSKNITGREIVDLFFEQEKEEKLAGMAQPANEALTISRKLRASDQFSTIVQNGVVELHVSLEPMEIIFVDFDSDCLDNLNVVHENGDVHTRKRRKGGATISVYRSGNVRILVDGPNGCEFKVRTTSWQFVAVWKWYETVLSDGHTMAASTLLFCLRIIFVEKSTTLVNSDFVKISSLLLLALVTLHSTTSFVVLFASQIAAFWLTFVFWRIVVAVTDIFVFFVPGSFSRLTSPPRRSVEMFINIFVFVLSLFYPAIAVAVLILLHAQKSCVRVLMLSIPLVVPLVLISLYSQFSLVLPFSSLQHVIISLYFLFLFLSRHIHPRLLDSLHQSDPSFYLLTVSFILSPSTLPLEAISTFALLCLLIIK